MKAPYELNAPAFRKGISGYSIADVDEYIAELMYNYEEMFATLNETREKLKVMVEGYSELKAKDETATSMIEEAKGISAALITQAKDHYEKTIAETEARVEEINAAMSASCKETLNTYTEMYEEEKKRLLDMEKKAQEFRAFLLGAYKKQLGLLCSTIPSGENEAPLEERLPDSEEFKAEATARFKDKVSSSEEAASENAE